MSVDASFVDVLQRTGVIAFDKLNKRALTTHNGTPLTQRSVRRITVPVGGLYRNRVENRRVSSTGRPRTVAEVVIASTL